jgi:hypothetical protein
LATVVCLSLTACSPVRSEPPIADQLASIAEQLESKSAEVAGKTGCTGLLRGFDVPYPEMNRVLGYAAKNIVQGFTVLDEARSAALFSYLDLDSDLHPPVVTSAEFQAATAFDGETERQVLRSQRLEQAYLRRRLLPGRVRHVCAVRQGLPR